MSTHRLSRRGYHRGVTIMQPLYRALHAQVDALRRLQASMGRGDLYESRLLLRDLHRKLEPVTNEIECHVALDDLSHFLEEEQS